MIAQEQVVLDEANGRQFAGRTKNRPPIMTTPIAKSLITTIIEFSRALSEMPT